MVRQSIEKKILHVFMIGLGFFVVGNDWMGLDIKTTLYSWFVVIIGFIVHSIWFKNTKDYIDKEQEKISFLYEEFDYLINSVIAHKNIKYEVCDIIISRPRKIQKNEWEVSIEGYQIDIFTGGNEDVRSTVCKILNIADTELEKHMNNKKGVKSFINTNITIIKLDEN